MDRWAKSCLDITNCQICVSAYYPSSIFVVLECLMVCMSLDNQTGDDPRKGVNILVEVGAA